MRGSEREFRPQCQSQCPPQNFHLVCSEGEYAAGCYQVRFVYAAGSAARGRRPAMGGFAARRGVGTVLRVAALCCALLLVAALPSLSTAVSFPKGCLPLQVRTRRAGGRGVSTPSGPKKWPRPQPRTRHSRGAGRGRAGARGWLAVWLARASVRASQGRRSCSETALLYAAVGELPRAPPARGGGDSLGRRACDRGAPIGRRWQGRRAPVARAPRTHAPLGARAPPRACPPPAAPPSTAAPLTRGPLRSKSIPRRRWTRRRPSGARPTPHIGCTTSTASSSDLMSSRCVCAPRPFSAPPVPPVATLAGVY